MQKPRLLVYYQDISSDVRPTIFRTVRLENGDTALPKCAWCKHRDLRLLVKVVWPGLTVDQVCAVGYCDGCHLSTVVMYETPAGQEQQPTTANRD